MVSPIASVRKDTIVVVSKTRETEVNEMGEGSLSKLIVPSERWEISSMKATK